MEKTINIRNNDINFSIWDLGGTRLREALVMCFLFCYVLFLFIAR
jgi:hypothetical protein